MSGVMKIVWRKVACTRRKFMDKSADIFRRSSYDACPLAALCDCFGNPRRDPRPDGTARCFVCAGTWPPFCAGDNRWRRARRPDVYDRIYAGPRRDSRCVRGPVYGAEMGWRGLSDLPWHQVVALPDARYGG